MSHCNQIPRVRIDDPDEGDSKHMISDITIRERSYQIWLCEGCPDGKSLEHWLRAEAELKAGFYPPIQNMVDWRRIMPRPRISHPPNRVIAWRVHREEAAIAATQ